jgi:HPt (histidine-containing phosphotransfer) domain-containing protein
MSACAQPRPVDLAHLGRYTGGDAALNSEVLQLFRNQSLELIESLGSHLRDGDAKGWRLIAHSLKGGARGIGAFGLADAAAAAEPFDPRAEPEMAAGALQALNAQVQAVASFIDAYLGR